MGTLDSKNDPKERTKWNLSFIIVGNITEPLTFLSTSIYFSFPDHPWILFYTEPTLETVTLRPKVKAHFRLTSLTATPGFESERNKLISSSSSLSDNSSPGSSNYLEDEDCGLVDVLAVAISRVRISEPKRSRLCSPTTPVQQKCSSNIKVNSLCTAF